MHFAKKKKGGEGRGNRETGLNGSDNTMRTAFDHRETTGDEAAVCFDVSFFLFRL